MGGIQLSLTGRKKAGMGGGEYSSVRSGPGSELRRLSSTVLGVGEGPKDLRTATSFGDKDWRTGIEV